MKSNLKTKSQVIYITTMPCVKRKKDDRKHDKNDKTYEEQFRELYPPYILMDIDGIQSIIEQNHFQEFEYNLSENIDNFCEKTFTFPNFKPNNIAKKQVDILSLVYDNCVKNYDLEFFYCNPELAEPFIKKDLEKDKTNIKQNTSKINIKHKKYDWTTKSYK